MNNDKCEFCNGTGKEPGQPECVWCHSTGTKAGQQLLTPPIKKTCETCHGGGEVCTGTVTHHGYNQPPEPDLETCPDCSGEQSWYVARDIDRLVRELDVLLNGDGAAAQARLADIVAQVAASQQGQGKPVAYLRASDLERLAQPHVRGCAASLEKTACEGFVGIYTHADPAEASKWRNEAHRFNLEVERLRDEAHQDGLLRVRYGKQIDELHAQLAEAQALLREADEFMYIMTAHDGHAKLAHRYGKDWWDAIDKLRGKVCTALSASAEPSATGDGVRDERDYAIEHAGYLADAADQVLADYQAYSLAQMLENEGGDDGDDEHAEAVDSARGELHEGLANLRSMTYEFRKRRHQAVNAASAEPNAPVEIDEQPEFVKTITAKLQRFLDCAEDGQGADIGREWFDVLTKLGLLRRIQRSPAWWEVTEQGDALFARAAQARKS